MEFNTAVDSLTKLISAGSGMATLYLIWTKALPKIEQIHLQTNSLTDKLLVATATVERAAGVQEERDRTPIPSSEEAQAAALILKEAAATAAAVLREAANVARSKEGP